MSWCDDDLIAEDALALPDPTMTTPTSSPWRKTTRSWRFPRSRPRWPPNRRRRRGVGRGRRGGARRRGRRGQPRHHPEGALGRRGGRRTTRTRPSPRIAPATGSNGCCPNSPASSSAGRAFWSSTPISWRTGRRCSAATACDRSRHGRSTRRRTEGNPLNERHPRSVDLHSRRNRRLGGRGVPEAGRQGSGATRGAGVVGPGGGRVRGEGRTKASCVDDHEGLIRVMPGTTPRGAIGPPGARHPQKRPDPKPRRRSRRATLIRNAPGRHEDNGHVPAVSTLSIPGLRHAVRLPGGPAPRRPQPGRAGLGPRLRGLHPGPPDHPQPGRPAPRRAVLTRPVRAGRTGQYRWRRCGQQRGATAPVLVELAEELVRDITSQRGGSLLVGRRSPRGADG